MVVRAVLFDMYGTLGVQRGHISFGEFISAAGYPQFGSDAVLSAFSSDTFDGNEHYEYSTSEAAYNTWKRSNGIDALLADGATQVEAEAVADVFDKWNLTFHRRMELFPEVRVVLDEVHKRGLVSAICSNWDWDISIALNVMGIADDVDYVFNSATLGVRKPHPEFFRQALAAMNVKAEDALFVGDNWSSDVVGAHQAGIHAVFVDRDRVGAPETLPRVDVMNDLTGVLTHLDS